MVSRLLSRSARGQEGQAMVEYAFLAVLVGLAAVVALALLGGVLHNVFQNVANGF
jgi:Flp pilus assembly pilin Flp